METDEEQKEAIAERPPALAVRLCSIQQTTAFVGRSVLATPTARLQKVTPVNKMIGMHRGAGKPPPPAGHISQ